jgi:hypothetical protein
MILELPILVAADGSRTVTADSPLLKGTLTLPGSQAANGQLCHLQVQLIQGRVQEGVKHPDLVAAEAKAAADKAAADAKAQADKATAEAAQAQALEATAEAAAKAAVDHVLHPDATSAAGPTSETAPATH